MNNLKTHLGHSLKAMDHALHEKENDWRQDLRGYKKSLTLYSSISTINISLSYENKWKAWKELFPFRRFRSTVKINFFHRILIFKFFFYFELLIRMSK